MLESVGVSIWQMALEPSKSDKGGIGHEAQSNGNGNGVVIDYDSESSDDDGDSNDLVDLHGASVVDNRRLALACDDGCVRLYTILDDNGLTYHKFLPRVSGECSMPDIICEVLCFFEHLKGIHSFIS